MVFSTSSSQFGMQPRQTMMAMPSKQRRCLDSPIEPSAPPPVSATHSEPCCEEEDAVVCRFFCLKILDRK